MKPFEYIRATSTAGAIKALGAHRDTKFLAGGTNLIDLMKMGVEQPVGLVNITHLPLTEIMDHEGGVRIGAMARNSAAANHPLIRSRYPVLSQALLAGASPQIRNMATVGGNLLQRTRCYYFYDPSYGECNKRNPGSGCAALKGCNRIHAILGGSDRCVATHPSDMAVALAALDAVIQIEGPGRRRSLPIAQLHRLPGNTPNLETELMPGELITSVDLPVVPAPHSHYLKVRDRNSYAFALVSVAAVINIDSQNNISEARVALGGVAPKPWRVPEAEVVRGARPLQHNAFKVELARRSVVRALSDAASA